MQDLPCCLVICCRGFSIPQDAITERWMLWQHVLYEYVCYTKTRHAWGHVITNHSATVVQQNFCDNYALQEYDKTVEKKQSNSEIKC